ncbi:hypothetical protein KY285_020636 [Solanum tuberosum]|nr:hypothetical protein KY285_020636 [Solanum tuberosum]
MDVTIPLPNSVKVMDTQGKVFEQQIWYDWRPQQCATCCLIGHDCKKDQQPQGKTQRPEVQKKEGPEPQSTKDNGNARVPTPVGLKEEWTAVKGKSATKSAGLMPIQPIETINGYQQLEEDTLNQMIQAVMKMLDRGTCSTSGVVKAPDLSNIAK